MSAASLSNISAAVVAGPDVKLVDLSRGGAMMEVAARFPMRSSVRLKLTKSTGEVTVAHGRVAWAKVASIIEGRINYRVALVFEEPIPDLTAAATGAPLQTAASPGSTVAFNTATNDDDLTAADEPLVSAAWDPAPAIVPTRGNLTRFPSDTGRRTENSPAAEASGELAERSRSIPAHAQADGLREEIALAAADLVSLAPVNEPVAAKLAESDQYRTALLSELETERRRWEEQRSTLVREAADAVTRAEALQAALNAREQEQAQTLSEQQGRYEALIAELVKTTNDQQTEYEHLLEVQTAARDEQRSRAEHYEAELARHCAAAEQQRADSEARRGELEARLDAAEALCAAHDARARGLRREAERLMSMITSPLRPGSPQVDEAAAACETEADDAQAVA